MADRVDVTPDVTPDPNAGKTDGVDGDSTRVQVTDGDKAAGKQQKQQGDRPEWLEEKFESVEDQAKAYPELQKKLGSRDSGTTPEPTSDSKTTGNKFEIPSSDDSNSDGSTDGIDFSALQTEYAEKGALAEESYKSLEEQGVSRETVDAFIAGQLAIANQYETRLVNAAGGEENLQTMLKWAGQALPKEKTDAYNRMLKSDVDTAEMAINALRHAYTEANGRVPSLVEGDTSPSAGGEKAYDSWAEASADIAKPEYRTNPSFRKMVESRLAVSNL
jgi:hypothetical protein